jgi:hypothetical protein
MEQIFYQKPWTPNFAAHPPAHATPLECVIIEPRDHPNLAATLKNMSCLLPYAAMTIFHSKENEAAVRAILGDHHTIQLRCFTEGNIDRDKYNAMLTDPAFWESLTSPKTLIFQTDAGIRKNGILFFMEYDYVGAPWPWMTNYDPKIRLGNGGLSLRDRTLMREICLLHRPLPDEAEDVFFSKHVVYMPHARVPTFEIASLFSVEHNTSDDPMGFHQCYRFHAQHVVEKWMQNTDPCCCPAETGLIVLTDAWIEFWHKEDKQEQEPETRKWSAPELKQWLALGVGSSGYRIPVGSFIACAPQEVLKADKSIIHMRFVDKNGLKGAAAIPLAFGRRIQISQ